MTVSQQQRQSQLFAGEDWRVLYTAFTKVNFSSYDFNTIRAAMVNYMRLTYPEDFNDWIESSEFVAIIDLLAYLGQSLAFRMDLNTRENFLDTAQRRESVFRLAKMLSYEPQRAIPGQGLVKITQLFSNQDIYDSNGLNLKNTTITWNDQNNPDWFEQFILVLNASLNTNNPFGSPNASGIVGSVSTELYEINNTVIPTSTLPFTGVIGGNLTSFELVNPNFSDATASTDVTTSAGYFFERSPNPLNGWNIIYRSDGNGNSSSNTGFFLMFKQGTIGYADYRLDYQIANRVIDIDADNINQTDVWVQNIDASGLVTKDWVKVPSVNGFNIIYNSLDKGIRDIYSVVTRDNNGVDRISIRFADGNFGNVPTGIIRVWYRVSNGLAYQIRPNDLSNLNFNFNYTDNLNNTYSIVFNATLQTTISNSQTRQSNDQIKLNASQVYYTQDRMVNGEDYNLYPLQSSQVLKIKAVNRTYSGHSRYVDINDPTGKYQNTNVFSEDGLLYHENGLNRQDIPSNSILNSAATITSYILPLINGSGGNTVTSTELRDFFIANYPRYPSNVLSWRTTNTGTGSINGAFFNGPAAQKLGSAVHGNSAPAYIRQGSLIKFVNSGWACVMDIIGDGDGISQSGVLSTGQGSVTLNSNVTSGDLISYIIPGWRTTLTADEIASMALQVDAKQTFGMGFDPRLSVWYPISNNNLSSSQDFSIADAKDTSSTNRDASWLIKMVYVGPSWQVYVRSQRYIFESVNDTRFYFANTNKVIDVTTGRAKEDYINVMGINTQPDLPVTLGDDYKWKIKNQYIYPDGYAEPRSVQVTFWDSKTVNMPDNPDEFTDIVNPSTGVKLLFWKQFISSDGYQYYDPIVIPSNRIYQVSSSIVKTDLIEGELIFVVKSSTFYQYIGKKLVDVTNNYKFRFGRNNLKYLWKHYSSYDQRIDPAVNNIIDMYVLTNGYDTDLRNWISSNGTIETKPTVPNTDDLRVMFGSFESYKMMTDQIIWHPVSYKILFGSQSDPAYQVRFKVVKAAGSTISDSEVKSKVIMAVNDYFSLSNWDFGSSFFFTELAAYLHTQLATVIGSVVIVPLTGGSKFGNLFEITANPDEIFISGARVSDVDIVTALSDTTLGITNG